jgi:hypothetical protein
VRINTALWRGLHGTASAQQTGTCADPTRGGSDRDRSRSDRCERRSPRRRRERDLGRRPIGGGHRQADHLADHPTTAHLADATTPTPLAVSSADTTAPYTATATYTPDRRGRTDESRRPGRGSGTAYARRGLPRGVLDEAGRGMLRGHVTRSHSVVVHVYPCTPRGAPRVDGCHFLGTPLAYRCGHS